MAPGPWPNPANVKIPGSSRTTVTMMTAGAAAPLMTWIMAVGLAAPIITEISLGTTTLIWFSEVMMIGAKTVVAVAGVVVGSSQENETCTVFQMVGYTGIVLGAMAAGVAVLIEAGPIFCPKIEIISRGETERRGF